MGLLVGIVGWVKTRDLRRLVRNLAFLSDYYFFFFFFFFFVNGYNMRKQGTYEPMNQLNYLIKEFPFLNYR